MATKKRGKSVRSRDTYATLKELKAATLATVRSEIAVLMNRELTEADFETFSSFVRIPKQWEHQHTFLKTTTGKSLMRNARAIAQIVDALQSHAAHQAFPELFEVVNTPEVARFVQAMGHLVKMHREEFWKRGEGDRDLVAKTTDSEGREQRLKGPMFWWKDRNGPSDRHRALLSLLAGNFPRLEGRVSELTPELVIQAEAEEIRSLRRGASSQKRKRQPTR